jgi:CspA family cold shock protein
MSFAAGAEPSSAVGVPVWDRDPSSACPEVATMPEGRIKKIIHDRGFGFVRGDDGNEVFFHRTELTTVDFDSLEEGQAVTFEVVNSPKGPRARNLKQAS